MADLKAVYVALEAGQFCPASCVLLYRAIEHPPIFCIYCIWFKDLHIPSELKFPRKEDLADGDFYLGGKVSPSTVTVLTSLPKQSTT